MSAHPEVPRVPIGEISASDAGPSAFSRGLICLVGAVSLFGCASAAPYDPSRLQPTQLSQIGEICRSTMGIPAGIRLSSSCVQSLSDSLMVQTRGRALQVARSQCLRQGAGAGEARLSECEVRATSSDVTRVSEMASPAIDAAKSTQSVKSYFYVSSGEIRRREELACAQLGFDPSFGGFGTCVANLSSALFSADHSAH